MPNDLAQAIQEAGLIVYVGDDFTVPTRIRPAYIRLKSIEWISPEKCYATLDSGEEVSIYFTQMENQIEIKQ